MVRGYIFILVFGCIWPAALIYPVKTWDFAKRVTNKILPDNLVS
jgi:hypothetical protein